MSTIKKYYYKKIRANVIIKVKEACRISKEGSRTWATHILPVTQYSLLLGKKMKADLEVLELAALLHDYASLVDFKKYKEGHHVYGAKFAREILKQTDLPKEKIDHIADCIISHRGSVKIKHKTVESRILASADAMSHITELGDMFYLVYGVHKMAKDEGLEWLKGKIGRSWNKLMPEGKKIVKEQYVIASAIINKAIKNQMLQEEVKMYGKK